MPLAAAAPLASHTASPAPPPLPAAASSSPRLAPNGRVDPTTGQLHFSQLHLETRVVLHAEAALGEVSFGEDVRDDALPATAAALVHAHAQTVSLSEAAAVAAKQQSQERGEVVANLNPPLVEGGSRKRARNPEIWGSGPLK